jgi:hypothetical protein
MSLQLTIEEYSEKAFVVRGDSKKYKEQLVNMKGKWNSHLTGGPGWIFSNRHTEIVSKFLESVNKSDIESSSTLINKSDIEDYSTSPELTRQRKIGSIDIDHQKKHRKI